LHSKNVGPASKKKVVSSLDTVMVGLDLS